jgi:hypothetical protein
MRCWLCLTREPGKWMGRGSLLVGRMHTRAAAALLLRRTMPLRRRTEHLPSARYLTPRFDLAQPVKMLLLGAGESGKSTIFKQMKVRASRPTAVHRVQPHDPCSHCLQPSHACHSTGRQPGAGVGEGEIGIVRPRTRPVGRWSDGTVWRLTPSVFACLSPAWMRVGHQQRWLHEGRAARIYSHRALKHSHVDEKSADGV